LSIVDDPGDHGHRGPSARCQAQRFPPSVADPRDAGSLIVALLVSVLAGLGSGTGPTTARNPAPDTYGLAPRSLQSGHRAAVRLRDSPPAVFSAGRRPRAGRVRSWEPGWPGGPGPPAQAAWGQLSGVAPGLRFRSQRDRPCGSSLENRNAPPAGRRGDAAGDRHCRLVPPRVRRVGPNRARGAELATAAGSMTWLVQRGMPRSSSGSLRSARPRAGPLGGRRRSCPGGNQHDRGDAPLGRGTPA